MDQGILFDIVKDNDYFRHKRNEMRWFLPQVYDKVLEIGCGDGAFIENLNPDCEVWGIEPNRIAAEVASRKSYKVLIGKYETIVSQLPDDYFNLVVCNDVIEHMDDYDAFLDSIKKKMRQNACLVGSIPNVRYYYNMKELLIKRDWKYTNEGILDRSHLRFFTKISFKRTLEQHGFLIEKYRGINRLKYDSYRLKSILHRIILYFTLVVTLGFYYDIIFLQFGFCARKLFYSDD